MDEDAREEMVAERAALAMRITPAFTEVLAEHRAEFGEVCGVNGNTRRFEEKLENALRGDLGLLASVDAAAVSPEPGENTWASISVSVGDAIIEVMIIEAPAPSLEEGADEVEEGPTD